MPDLIDIVTPAAPGSLMRSAKIHQVGSFRISRRDCELYSVQIVGAGSYGRAFVRNGLGRVLWQQISCFTGSFWLSAGAIGGLIVELRAASDGDAANLTVNFRELDRQSV